MLETTDLNNVLRRYLAADCAAPRRPATSGRRVGRTLVEVRGGGRALCRAVLLLLMSLVSLVSLASLASLAGLVGLVLVSGCGTTTSPVKLGPLTSAGGLLESGLPGKFILPAGVGQPNVPSTVVTMTAQAGGTPYLLPATAVANGAGGTFVLTVTLPTLPITVPTNYIFTAAENEPYQSFQTSPSAPILVQPGPTLSSITPSSGQAASTVSVTLTGISTAWVNGTTTATFGTDLNVNGAAAGAPGVVQVGGATSAVASVSIPDGASPGTRTVTVATGNQILTLPAGFTVTPAPLPPVASAGGPYTGTTGLPIAFSGAASTDPAGLALTYSWSFGDGGTAPGVAPTHTYAAAGTYKVALVVTNAAGLSSTAASSAVVADPPKPPVANAGGPYTGTAGTAISFTGSASSDPKAEPLDLRLELRRRHPRHRRRPQPHLHHDRQLYGFADGDQHGQAELLGDRRGYSRRSGFPASDRQPRRPVQGNGRRRDQLQRSVQLRSQGRGADLRLDLRRRIDRHRGRSEPYIRRSRRLHGNPDRDRHGSALRLRNDGGNGGGYPRAAARGQRQRTVRRRRGRSDRIYRRREHGPKQRAVDLRVDLRRQLDRNRGQPKPHLRRGGSVRGSP